MSKTILVAEDDVMVRNMLVRTLERHGYEVLEADNALEAMLLSKNSRRNIDLLVAEEFLNVMRAGELFEQLRQSRPNLKMMQISDRPLTILEALLPGVEFMQKPLIPGELVGKVKEIFNRGQKGLSQGLSIS